MTNRHSFDAALERLHDEMDRMVTLVNQAVQKSVVALKQQDIALAQEVIAGDDEVDEQESRIEHLCLQLIATQQPLARDLRTIGSALKIITDLERIADHASDISEITLRMQHEKYIKPLVDIPRMAGMAVAMVGAAIEAYIRQDATAALEICKNDDDVDALFSQIVTELASLMKENPAAVDQGIDFIFVSKYLERIADHATNIAEWVVYNVTGNHPIHLN